MTDTGYTLIEYPSRTPLAALCADPGQFELALALLEFLRSRLNQRFDTSRFEVITAEYHGAYPCLAIRGGEPQPGPDEVLAVMDEVMRGATVASFVEFAQRDGTDWNERARAFRAPR